MLDAAIFVEQLGSQHPWALEGSIDSEKVAGPEWSLGQHIRIEKQEILPAGDFSAENRAPQAAGDTGNRFTGGGQSQASPFHGT